MTFYDTFIDRPVGTTLLTVALAMAGVLGYNVLPVSPLPQVEFPTISVNASLPGASPETMASSVATPLERQFGRIAGVTEMNSTNSLGSTTITMQFDLNRNIDAAARDVQASINAARTQLPANLPSNPSYKKVNPADAPILILTVSSEIYGLGEMYDAAASILQQKLSQVSGVGQVSIGGGALPAVRVDVNPTKLNALNLSLEDVRAALGTANANRPKGFLEDDQRTINLATTDQLLKAKGYRSLIIAYRRGAPVRLEDVANVADSVEDVRTSGLYNGRPAIVLIVFRQPGANIIETVDRVKDILPVLQSEIPAGMHLGIASDRTVTIRASVRDVEGSLVLSVALVVVVVFVFLRDLRATFIPGIAVPISLVSTFGVMYLWGYSIDNLSLMALTIATGFVVDDAIVVVENVIRYLEQGLSPHEAAVKGVREIGFTVVSISVSLVAVFIPILLMGGIVGRLFREFAVTLSVAIGISLVVSLTTTAMMCAKLLRPMQHGSQQGLAFRAIERVLELVQSTYAAVLRRVLRHQLLTYLVTLGTVVLTGILFATTPKGFFPQQDTGRLTVSLLADQATSFQETRRLLGVYAKIISEDQATYSVIGFTGGNRGAQNAATLIVQLKALDDRPGDTADTVIARLRKKFTAVPGATLLPQAFQDIRIGAFNAGAQYQYTLRGDSLDELNEFAPQVLARLRKIKGLTEVNSDQQDHGLQAMLTLDRETASRMGVSAAASDNTLYDAFGQRQVSTIYTQLNQYHVVMEVDPSFWQSPDGLRYTYARTGNGSLVPLRAFSQYKPATTLLSVTHAGQFPAVTLSFNLQPGFALGDAVLEIQNVEREIGLPATIHASFQGTAQAFQASLASEPYLILAALTAVYIVLGILYESLIHPITILSTIPSAGIGALLGLRLTGTDLSVIAIIGVILLIGIVKKNAIMMIDFALDAERNGQKRALAAIYEACVLRFRPITMTTLAALLGALPLALGTGTGSELRRPLGIAIVGGLTVSQMLTLFTTPVVYLYMERTRGWLGKDVSRWFLFFGLGLLPIGLALVKVLLLDLPTALVLASALPILLLVGLAGHDWERERLETAAKAA